MSVSVGFCRCLSVSAVFFFSLFFYVSGWPYDLFTYNLFPKLVLRTPANSRHPPKQTHSSEHCRIGCFDEVLLRQLHNCSFSSGLLSRVSIASANRRPGWQYMKTVLIKPVRQRVVTQTCHGPYKQQIHECCHSRHRRRVLQELGLDPPPQTTFLFSPSFTTHGELGVG